MMMTQEMRKLGRPGRTMSCPACFAGRPVPGGNSVCVRTIEADIPPRPPRAAVTES